MAAIGGSYWRYYRMKPEGSFVVVRCNLWKQVDAKSIWLCTCGDEISSALHVAAGIEKKRWRQHKIDIDLVVLLEFLVSSSRIQPLGLA